MVVRRHLAALIVYCTFTYTHNVEGVSLLALM